MGRRRNYAYYRHSIIAARALLPTKSALVEKLRKALIDLDEEIGEKERAPKLARLELDLKLAQGASELSMPVDQWKDLVSSYWTRWGSKGSVVPELEGVQGERSAWLRDMMGEIISKGHVSLLYKIERMLIW